MRMKNKQNVAWSTFRYFVLAFLLCLSVVPLRGQPDAAVLSSPSADSLIIFSYPSRIRMFKTEYADNRLSLRKLKKIKCNFLIHPMKRLKNVLHPVNL